MSDAPTIGDSAERQVVLSSETVRAFADLIDDHNPLHVDEGAASASRFGRPVVHGMLSASLFSGLIASVLPGPGSIYVTQAVRFSRPIPVGSRVLARIECVAVDTERRRATLRTTVRTEDGIVCVDGEAVVAYPQSR